MPVPTPDEYIPYDENAPATFITARTGAYIYRKSFLLAKQRGLGAYATQSLSWSVNILNYIKNLV